MNSWPTRIAQIVRGLRPLAGFALITGLSCIGWVTLDKHPVSGLVSYDPLPPESTEECAYQPVSLELPPLAGKIPLRAALLQERIDGKNAFACDPLGVGDPKPMASNRG